MADETMEKSGKTIGSILKAAEVLEILAQAPSGLGATEVSRKMGLGVSGIYHILNTMKACGMIDQDPVTKKYEIGLGLYSLCSQSRTQDVFGRRAQPYLDRLSQICGETSNLILLRGLQIVYAAQASMNHNTQMFTQLGSSAPYYCTGAGKAMLAFLSEDEWERYISNTGFKKYTDHTIADGESLKKELAEIRANGVAYDREEREDGVSCVAVPVFNAAGQPVAAISVSGPTGRIREKIDEGGLVEVIRDTARRMSEEMW